MTYNLSLDWRITERMRLGFSVVNLRNTPPHRDATNSTYPYYDQFQFDPIGRQYFLEFAYRFGGSVGH
jgi:outer membrane receptor protein involved in Fe transport